MEFYTKLRASAYDFRVAAMDKQNKQGWTSTFLSRRFWHWGLMSTHNDLYYRPVQGFQYKGSLLS